MASARSLAQLQYDMQVSLMDKAYEQNMQATKDERAYNTPSAQLARLSQAGLNPLYFGLDGNSSNGAPFTASTPQAPDTANAEQASYARFQAIQQSIGQVMQASKNLAEVRQMEEQTRLMSKQGQNVEADTTLKRIESQWKPVLHGMELRTGESVIHVNMSQKDVNTESARELQLKNDNIQIYLDNIQSNTKLNNAKSAESLASKALMESEQGLNVVRASNLRADTAYKNQLRQTEEANTGIAFEKYAQEIMRTGALPKQLINDFNLTDAKIKNLDSSSVNLRAFARVASAQEDKIRGEMIIDGVRIGIFKSVKDGKVEYDIPKALDISTANKIANTFGTYAKLYEDWQNSSANAMNATANIIGSVIPGLKLNLGTKNPVSASPRPDWATETYY